MNKFIFSVLIFLTIVLMPMAFLSGTLDPIGNGKLMFLTALVGAGLFWLSYQWLAKGRLVWQSGILNLAVLVLLAAAAVSTFLSLSPWVSLWGDAAGKRGLFGLLLAGGIYLLIVGVFPAGRGREPEKKENISLGLMDNSAVPSPQEETADVLAKAENRRFKMSKFGFSPALLLGIGLTTLLALLQLYGWFVFPWDFTHNNFFNPVGSVQASAVLAAIGLVMSLAWVLLGVGSAMERGAAAAVLLLTAFYVVAVEFPVAWLVLAIGSGGAAAALLIRQTAFNRAAIFVLLTLIGLGLAFPGISKIRPPALVATPLEISPSRSASLAIAGKGLEERPVLGTGLGTFPYLYSQHRSQALNSTIFWSVRFGGGSSTFTSLIGEIGYVGSAAWLGMLAVGLLVLISALFISKKNTPVFLAGGLAAAIGASFVYPFTLTLLLVLFVLLGILTRSLGRTKVLNLPRQTEETRTDLKMKGRFLYGTGLALLLMLAGLFGFYLQILHYAAAVKVAQAANSGDDGARRLSLLGRASSFEPRNGEIWRRLAEAALLEARQVANQPAAASSQNDLAQSAQRALQAAQRATQMEPLDSASWITLGRVYEAIVPISDLGAVDFAVNAYQEALRRDPQNPDLATAIGRTKLVGAARLDQQRAVLEKSPKVDQDKIKQMTARKDQLLKEGVEAFQQAVALKADYAPAHFGLVRVYGILGRTDQAIESATALLRGNPRDPGLWFQLGLLTYRKQDYVNAQAAFEQAVQLFPDYSNARYFLGLTEGRQGDNAGALEQFQRVAELNPDNQEVKRIIGNLRAGREPLAEIVPPAQPPLERNEPPVKEKSVEQPQVKPEITPPPVDEIETR